MASAGQSAAASRMVSSLELKSAPSITRANSSPISKTSGQVLTQSSHAVHSSEIVTFLMAIMTLLQDLNDHGLYIFRENNFHKGFPGHDQTRDSTILKK